MSREFSVEIFETDIPRLFFTNMFDVDLPGVTIRVMGAGVEVSLIPWTCVGSSVVVDNACGICKEYYILNKHPCLWQCPWSIETSAPSRAGADHCHAACHDVTCHDNHGHVTKIEIMGFFGGSCKYIFSLLPNYLY